MTRIPLHKIDRKTVFQFGKFLVVGCLNTGLSLAVIFLLQNGLGVKYTLANLIGYTAGVINSFFWNKLWVFQQKKGDFMRETVLFLLVFALCYGLQFISLRVLVEKLAVPATWAQLAAMGVYTVANYLLNRCITFKKPSSLS